ncbi:hypothetical protein Nepgr_029740 [Nepenthes gracilis]|uniref:Uncharacterized protein n=1 Tax=Nepenthes gracilis TaxID=150966 RepID=A0AAD3Y398_NEPGR|nr:hypothetical protein Nepgr_029740 [Nepenthes gracilis]
MVNLFDLTSTAAGNKLLTEKPRDGSPLSRSRSDVSRMSSPIDEEIEDKVIVSELRRPSSGKKTEGTPMKMLIAQEMLKDLDSKCNPPNLVAKLMGLDGLPPQQLPDIYAQRHHSNTFLPNSHSEMPMGFWHQEQDILNRGIDCKVHQYQEQNECKDIYEIWQQSQRKNLPRDVSLLKERFNENTNEKKMALVRQKFMELKRLAMDAKLHQTKEFQDALDVLNSHRDLFITFLQEQNSLFSQHLYAGRTIPPPQETKHITVLRPSKLVFDNKFATSGKKSEKLTKKLTKVDKAKGWDNHNCGFYPTIPTWKPDNTSSQPTRIVVLKPNSGKTHDLEAFISPIPSSPRNLRAENFLEKLEYNEIREAGDVAKKITQQMCENLGGHWRDETLLPSVFSNGYTGDESSFNNSEADFAVENLSDSEVISSTSRHSWDYVNRYSSPCSSSFSRGPYSPESSVCREAKKRLSERWAMMTSNWSNQQHKHMRRSSSTLGEMLSLSDVKKPIISEEDCRKVQGPRGSTSYLSSDLSNAEGTNDYPGSLQRSKSVPVSSTAFGGRLNVEVSNPPVVCNAGSGKDSAKVKTAKSSFKGRVTSLFFPRNKKSVKEKAGKSESKGDFHTVAANIPGSHVPPGPADNVLKCKNTEDVLSSLSVESTCSAVSPPNFDGKPRPAVFSQQQAGLFSSKPAILAENQGHPSPVSVLEPPFEEDDNPTQGSSGGIKPNYYGKTLPLRLSTSNLIDKSPPIGSVARTLSWDESCAEQASSHPSTTPLLSPGIDRGEWPFLVQLLLSAAGLDDISQLGLNFARWHSLESPLDPLLREKYLDLTAKEPLHGAKRRQLRSSCKLVFDCVNAAIVDATTSVSSNRIKWAPPLGGAHGKTLDNASLPILADGVWAQMKEWFSDEASCDDGGDDNSLAERVVRKEVIGKGWARSMNSEVDDVGKQIEGKLLDELVEESVVEWTDR